MPSESARAILGKNIAAPKNITTPPATGVTGKNLAGTIGGIPTRTFFGLFILGIAILAALTVVVLLRFGIIPIDLASNQKISHLRTADISAIDSKLFVGVGGPGIDAENAIQARKLRVRDEYELPEKRGTAGQTIIDLEGDGVISWESLGPASGVSGPSSSTSDAIARYSGSSGDIIKNSGLVVGSSGDLDVATAGPLVLGATTATSIELGAATTHLLNGGAAGDDYVMASTRGSNGQVLMASATALTHWVTPDAAGDVSGPPSSSADAIAIFSGTGGNVIANSNLVLSSGGGIGTHDGGALVLGSGTTSGVVIAAPSTRITNGTIANNDYILATTRGTNGQVLTASAGNTTHWVTPAAAGDVSGPPSSSTNAITIFSGTGGKVIANSNLVLSSGGGIGTHDGGALVLGSGTTSGVVIAAPSTRITNGTIANNDYILATTRGTNGQVLTASAGNTTNWVTPAAAGDVYGPPSSSTNAIAIFSGTGGNVIANSNLTLGSGGGIGTQDGGSLILGAGTTSSVIIVAPSTRITNGAIAGNDYILATTRGTNGQVLTASAGNTTHWVTPGTGAPPAGPWDVVLTNPTVAWLNVFLVGGVCLSTHGTQSVPLGWLNVEMWFQFTGSGGNYGVSEVTIDVSSALPAGFNPVVGAVGSMLQIVGSIQSNLNNNYTAMRGSAWMLSSTLMRVQTPMSLSGIGAFVLRMHVSGGIQGT
jgi:hypothetical protein